MAKVKTVLAFGDSLTWGYEAGTAKRHTFEDRWPNALAAELGAGYRVIADEIGHRQRRFDEFDQVSKLAFDQVLFEGFQAGCVEFSA